MKSDTMNGVMAGGCVAMGMMVSPLAAAQVTLNVTEDGASLDNGLVSVVFDLAKSSYTVTDRATGEVVLADAGVTPLANDIEFSPLAVEAQEDVTDVFGKGKRLVLRVSAAGFRSQPDVAQLYSFSLYESEPAVVMGFGMKSPPWHRSRLMEAYPLAHAQLLPGKVMTDPLTLNGSAGSEPASVKPGLSRSSPNSLMLTGLVEGNRRTIVWGGLGYAEFGKYAAIRNGRLELKASDPVGRLVDDEATYLPKDTFYLDVVTAEPFAALEKYGRAMRATNNAKPNVYDFPVLCGWSVGAISKLPDINTSEKLVGELETAQKAGLTRYTKVGIRLEPDTYCYKDGNTEQGWWDDAHWVQYGHLVPPYDTFAKWCAAIRERDGVPYTYFQVGMPSDDYAKAFPGHMLFNDISKLGQKHSHHRPLVSFDYTDPEFQAHMREVWARLRRDGIRGIKFDYPETGWRPEGGFENRHATTAFAYREAFRLCREGLGADAFLDERNLGESGRPCLDVTAGIVDTQRNWTDSNAFVPGMISIGGLRWYKNRTVFNYFPDTKTVHGCAPGIRQSMLTMVYLTSGRIDLATSFTLFTPEIVRDFSRIYPAYREPFTARPLDAFTGVADPQVYDLELAPDWHQVALFNTSANPGPVAVALSGDRIANAIGLDPNGEYYAYEFWTDTFLGKLPGTARLERTLEPSHCAMIGLRKVQPHPQVLATDRHLLQGWLELEQVKWGSAARRLSGIAKVIGGEAFKLVVANNGLKPLQATAQDGTARLATAASPELSAIVLERPTNGNVAWQIEYGDKDVTTYRIDPVSGDDANPPGKPWKSFGRLNEVKLAPGDTVLVSPGVQEESLVPAGEGTAGNPVVIQFLPGVHTIDVRKVLRKQLFISNTCDSPGPMPIGIMLSGIRHFRLQGGGIAGPGKTTLLYDGRMMQILVENSEDLEFSGLVLDMKRPAVSEIRVLEAQDSTATIQVAKGSDYQVENGRFLWRGDWLGGNLLTQEVGLKAGVCRRRGPLRGWTSEGQVEAKATDLGDRKVRLEFPAGASGLVAGCQYHFRNIKRVMAGVHCARSARIAFRDCEVNALPCMGFVSQFTDTMTFQRVNVLPPANTIRTCPAWADIFQFSNCKGNILVDSCRLTGMQDDALNCHGTYLRIVGKGGAQQLQVRYAHPQTYGFAPYAAGDELAVISAGTMREYAGNPRGQVAGVARVTDTDWLITLDGPMPVFNENDVVDNLTWNPNLTARNNHVSVDPARGFLVATRGKVVVENNTFERCRSHGILVEGDAKKWFESSPIRDLEIRGNRFIDCGIQISSTVSAPRPEEPVHENIRILDNTFENGDIAAAAVKGLVARDNQSVPSPLKVAVAASCTDVEVDNKR